MRRFLISAMLLSVVGGALLANGCKKLEPKSGEKLGKQFDTSMKDLGEKAEAAKDKAGAVGDAIKDKADDVKNGGAETMPAAKPEE